MKYNTYIRHVSYHIRWNRSHYFHFNVKRIHNERMPILARTKRSFNTVVLRDGWIGFKQFRRKFLGWFFWKRCSSKLLKTSSSISQNHWERQFDYGFAVVPYIHVVTEPIKIILCSHNVKVAQKRFLTLNHIFAKPKDPVPKEQTSDAIYSVLCNDCNQEYIGQTKRLFGTRLKEHQKAVFPSKKDNSALSQHTCQTNHMIAWDNSKIITTNRRYHQGRCLEAWHINSAHAPLNRDAGGLLPVAYLHLINWLCHHKVQHKR